MADAAHPSTPRPSHRLRYTIIALLCIGAVVWMVTLMQKNVVFFKTGERGGRRPLARRRPHHADRRRGRSRIDPPHRRRRRLQAHRGRRHGVGRPPRHRADAVQELRAGGRRRSLERQHVRVRADPDQARLDLRPEEGHQGDLPAGSVRTREGAARLRHARDRHRGRGARRRDPRRRHPAAPAGAAAARAPLRAGRAARGGRRVRGDGVGAVRPRLLDRVRRRQRRARRPASTRSPPRGARSKVRSCCGRSRSRPTSASRRGGSASAPKTRSSRGPRSCSSSCSLFFFLAHAVPGEPVPGDPRRDPHRRARARIRSCRTTRSS